MNVAVSVLYSTPLTHTLPKPVIGPAATPTPVRVMPPVGGGGGGGETPPSLLLLPPQPAKRKVDNASTALNFRVRVFMSIILGLIRRK
jgi:hypothetical protein